MTGNSAASQALTSRVATESRRTAAFDPMHEHDVIAGAVATHDVAVVFDL